MFEKYNKNLIVLVIFIIVILIAGAFWYVNKTKPPQEAFLSPQEAAQKAIDYINKNMLQEGLTALLVNSEEENGVYKIHFKISEKEYDSYVTKDGKLLFIEGIDLETTPVVQTIGNFSISKNEVCKENEKPIIYFFGSTSCPHCAWEHPIIEKVVKNFEEYISFHNNMDSNNDMDVFSKYSTGSIPALVFGCKYYRIGSGEQVGEEEESKVLTALICKLTQNQPTDICNGVQDLISQIHE